MITDWKSDILCLSETWLRPSSTVDTHLTQKNFTLFRRDRPSRSHGGTSRPTYAITYKYAVVLIWNYVS